ncbi:MAG TPA: iron-containing alcohol dehydrogenase, partial [Dehalococcoidia bacterium]|nr:iron-containing alcohol dehydrogenase [Dehalococcoidia bacterium]
MPSFALRVETVFGEGSIAELGKRARAAGYKHALVVTDPGIKAAGILDSVLSSLDEAEIAHTVYDNVNPNPTTTEVDGGVQAYTDAGADFVVAVGGGSAIDAAKGV